MSDSIRPISQLLEDERATLTKESMSIERLLEIFHERGFGALLLVFSLPMALPLPVPPGINILLASPLLLLTAQQALGRHIIWMPERMKARRFSRSSFEKTLDNIIPWLKKLEILTKPRLAILTSRRAEMITGMLGFIMALCVCIPIPLTNTIPSLGIAMMALGVLMRDGLAVIAGAVIGITWVVMLACVVLFLGVEGIDLVKETIKSIL